MPNPELDIQLLVTDLDLNVLGDPIVDWEDLDATVRFNQPGSGYALLPAYDHILEVIDAGHRIVLIRDGQVFNSGPIEGYRFLHSDDGDASGTGTIAVNWADDLAWVAGRITYPNPALAPAAQDTDRWTFSGNAETAIRNLVNLNAGPGALSARQVPQLVLGDVAGVGGTVEVATRLQPLMDEIRAIAIAGGGLGVRTRQVADQILFEVFAPEDLSGDIRFGFGLGNVRSLELEVSAPTATAVIVGGQGEGVDRAVIERGDTAGTAAWGRLEKLVDRRGSEGEDLLEQAGDEALVEDAETVRLAANVYATDDQLYGEHFNIGDRVSLEVWPGREVNDVVRTVHLAVSATSGEIVTVYVGSQEASSDPQWVQRMRRIDRRLDYLAANAETPTA